MKENQFFLDYEVEIPPDSKISYSSIKLTCS